MKLIETNLDGCIVSKVENLDFDAIQKFREAKLLVKYSEKEIIEEAKETAKFERISLKKAMKEWVKYRTGVYESFIEDRSPDIVKVSTNKGIVYIIAQSIDGHGSLKIAQEC